MKLCKDCVHCEEPGSEHSKCLNSGEPNLVTGERHLRYCSTERTFPHLCGPNARYFQARYMKDITPQEEQPQAKPSWLQRLIVFGKPAPITERDRDAARNSRTLFEFLQNRQG